MPELTAEDEQTMRALGISREAFIATRKAEKARAEMAGPCKVCGHSADHPCSAPNCACNGEGGVPGLP